VRINVDKKDSKFNYNYTNKNNYYSQRWKKDNDEFGPKKFYGKIKVNNDGENKPKKNYNDIENKKGDLEGEENFQKPTFVNSQLDKNERNENIKELETKGDLFLEKFIKFDDSSKGIQKIEGGEEEHQDQKEGEDDNYRYYKKNSNKRKYHKNYNYSNNYHKEDYYFDKVLGNREEKEEKEDKEEEKEEEKKEKKYESKHPHSKKEIKKKEKEKKEEEDKIEGVIKEGNKTIVKGSGAKNLKDLFSKK
jgi:hypothetical protein